MKIISGRSFKDVGGLYVVADDSLYIIYTGEGFNPAKGWNSWSRIDVGDRLATGGKFTAAMLAEASAKATEPEQLFRLAV